MTKPYFIIVSDEGTSSKPKRHESYIEAKSEAFRLSKLMPGINFTVFESKSHVWTQKPVVVDSVFTEHKPLANNDSWRFWYGYPATPRFDNTKVPF